MRLTRLAPCALLFLALCVGAAVGQAQRTFVSGSGSDSNLCSRAAPCRTFNQAISQTNAGGEVTVLDSAGYGAFQINKSIAVVSPPGVYAGISVFSGVGVHISAGASDVVTLRGLSINGQGTSSGISSSSVGTLRVESCVVRGFPNGGRGVDFETAGTLVVKDTVISDCYLGIYNALDSGTARLTIDHVTVVDCANAGVEIFSSGTATLFATIRDTDLSGNHIGVEVEAPGGGALARLDVERCLITGGTTGVIASSSSAWVSISNCVITRNTNGFSIISGGTIYTRSNNTIIGNGSNTGSLTPLAAQ